MTQLLEEVISKIRDLPPTEQDAVAAMILEELADEGRWDESFARSQDKLGELARTVRAETRGGRIRKGGFDEL